MGRFSIRKILDNKIVNNAIIIVCTVTLIYSLFMIGSTFFYSLRGNEIMDDLQKIMNNKQYVRKSFHEVSFDSILSTITLNLDPENGGNDPEERSLEVLDKYKDLVLINEDIIGWIKVPGTDIDYPIVQGRDNSQYLNMTHTGESNRHGAIFMDYRNSKYFDDMNTVIYGHNMRLKPHMFRPLPQNYQNEDFFYNNRVIQVDSIYEEQKWEIFSVYVTEVTFNYTKTRFNTPEEFTTFIQEIKKKSLFPTDTEVTEDDCILTLSTCTYEFSNARFVVHAKKIKDEG
ncbi:MAG TPA: class B sortase [Candidatus Atribacteria bacterium]|nr:class B sortase [Candidatus Atribacteria bacterium]HPT77962.1 class B sortase [Candidatus Atribacteria bacterium]